MKLILPALLALVTASALAADLPSEWLLPAWAQQQWNKAAKSNGLILSGRINPFAWRGDFDGDERQDFALFVRRASDGKEGIVFLWRSGAAPVVLGAGKDFGNGGDDFSWVDFWAFEEGGTLQKSYYEESIRLKTDGIVVARAESASALIYFKEGKARWHQQGD